MPIRNVDYWKEEHNKLHRRVDNDAKKLDAIYKSKLKGVNGQIEAFYKKYSVDNELTIKEAKQLLSPKEYRAFNAKLSAWIKSGKYSDDKSFVASMERMRGTSKIDRLQRLKTEITANISDLKKKTAVITQDSLEDTFKETEKATSRVVQETLKQTSEGKIRAVINTEFMGRRFSPRIWTQRANLTDRLFNTLADNFVEGKNWNDLKTDLKRTFGATDHEARRLLITETARINSIAKENSYAEAGFTHYQYISVSDDRTSDVCVAHDDKIFKIEDMVVGLNAPPLHVYCRSTIVPYEMAGDEPIQIPPKPIKKPIKPKAKPISQMTKGELDKALDGMEKDRIKESKKYTKERDVLEKKSDDIRTKYREDRKKTHPSSKEYTELRTKYKADKKSVDDATNALDDADAKAFDDYMKKQQPYLDQKRKIDTKAFEDERKRLEEEHKRKMEERRIAEEKRLKKARSADENEIANWYKSSFEKQTPDYIRKQIDHYDNKFVGLLHSPREGAYYNNFGGINMSKYKHTDKNGQGTFRHEYGHFLDDFMGRDKIGGETTGYRSYYSSRRDFTMAMDADRKTILANAGYGRSSKAQRTIKEARQKTHDDIELLYADQEHHKIDTLENKAFKEIGVTRKDFDKWYKEAMPSTPEAFERHTERKTHILKAIAEGDTVHFFKYARFYDYDMYTETRISNPLRSYQSSSKSQQTIGWLSDMVGATTSNRIAGGGKLYGGWGHSNSYFKHAGARQTENFANLTALLSHDEKVNGAILDKFMPKMKDRYITDLKGAN